MSFINSWSGTQLVRNGWVLICRMLLLSWSLLMCWCTFSKPFIFRRLCKYQPPESLQGSAMQVICRHQVCRVPFHGGGKCRDRLTIPLTYKNPKSWCELSATFPKTAWAVPQHHPVPLWFHQVCVWQLLLALERLWLAPHGLGRGLNLGGDSGVVLDWDSEYGHGLCPLLFRKLPPVTWTTLGFSLDFFSSA